MFDVATANSTPKSRYVHRALANEPNANAMLALCVKSKYNFPEIFCAPTVCQKHYDVPMYGT